MYNKLMIIVTVMGALALYSGDSWAKVGGKGFGIIRVGHGHCNHCRCHHHHNRCHRHRCHRHSCWNNTYFNWASSSTDIEACRTLERPVFLYIYDYKKNRNHTARYFEHHIFASPEVQAAVQGFTCLSAPITSEKWPQSLRVQATGGAALFLMTCDGTVHRTWRKDARPMTTDVVLGARAIQALNHKAVSVVKSRDQAPRWITAGKGDVKAKLAKKAEKKAAADEAKAPKKDALLEALRKS